MLCHPLIVDLIESDFVPVFVNNRANTDLDQRDMERFDEITFNNPVVRIVDPQGKDLVPRIVGDYSVRILAEGIQSVLRKSDSSPEWLDLLCREEIARTHASKAVTFIFESDAPHEAEVKLAELDGIFETRVGFIKESAAVQARIYLPEISVADFLAAATNCGLSGKIWTPDGKIADAAGDRVERVDFLLTPDATQKKHITESLWRFVPMTELQAIRINARLARGQKVDDFVSPSQADLFKRIESQPDAGWKNAIGTDDLLGDWKAATVRSNKLD